MGDRKETVLAICYDFDKTLSPTDMQAQGYIQSVGYDVDEFWEKTNALAQANEMDSNLAYMYVMMDEARGRLMIKTIKKMEPLQRFMPAASITTIGVWQYGQRRL